MNWKLAALVPALIGMLASSPECLAFTQSWYGPQNFFSIERQHARPVKKSLHRKQQVSIPEHWLESYSNNNFDESWESIRTFPLDRPLRRPLKVYVAAPNNRLYKPQYRQYVLDALEQWSAALDGRLKYTLVNRPKNSDIQVHWVAGFPEADQAGNTEFGIGFATVEIKTPGLPDNIIRSDIMHEFGHALGLASHSNLNEDIMVSCKSWHSFEEYKTFEPRLSERDVAAIRRLYSSQWRSGEDVYATLDAVASRIAMQPAPPKLRVTRINRRNNNRTNSVMIEPYVDGSLIRFQQ